MSITLVVGVGYCVEGYHQDYPGSHPGGYTLHDLRDEWNVDAQVECLPVVTRALEARYTPAMTDQHPIIRPFLADEWPLYRDLRLRALRDSPDAYGSILALEASLSDVEWADRLARGVHSARELPLVAECAGEPCGLAWVRLGDDAPDSAHLYQMWVAAEQRRRRVGRALVDTAADWARRLGAKQLDLDVTSNNDAAVRLYEGAGFVVHGERRPLRADSTLEAQAMRLEL